MKRGFFKNFAPPSRPKRFAFFTCKKCAKRWKQALPPRGDGVVLPDFDVQTFCDECLEKMTTITESEPTVEQSAAQPPEQPPEQPAEGS